MDSTTVVTIAVAFGFAIFARFAPASWKDAALSNFTRGVIRLCRLLCFIATLGKNGRLPFAQPLESTPALDEQAIALEKAKDEYDYVVVGAGPGGLAALRQILKSSSSGDAAARKPTVLVVEAGLSLSLSAASAAVPSELSPLRLPAYAVVAAHVKHGYRGAAQGYVRGKGVGGTSLIDRGFVMNPSSSNEWRTLLPNTPPAQLTSTHRDIVDNCVRSWPVCFSSPIAEVFIETVAASALKAQGQEPPAVEAEDTAYDSVFDSECIALTKYGADDADIRTAIRALKPSIRSTGIRGVVQRLWSRFDPHVGCAKTILSHELLRDVPPGQLRQQVDLLLRSTVKQLNVEAERVTSISVGERSIRVRRGVIVAAGAHVTPTLLPPLLNGNSPRIDARDAMCTPLVYQAMPGITADAINAQSLVAVLKHAAATPNFMATATARATGVDSNEAASNVAMSPWDGNRVVLYDVPCDGRVGCGVPPSTTTTVAIDVMCCGGFNRELFDAQGWSHRLGVLKEAFTFRVTAYPPSSIVHTPTAKLAMKEATIVALRWCREVVRADPLRNLTSGREVLDLEIMSAEMKVNVNGAFKFLYGTVKGRNQKSSLQLAAQAGEVFARVNEAATQPEYLAHYVDRYAQSAGYACATLDEGALAYGSDVVVRGVTNLVVGDASVVREVTLNGGANVITAAVVGSIAAQTLLARKA